MGYSLYFQVFLGENYLIFEICQKPAYFLFAKMALLSNFFQVFPVLEVYNFELDVHWA